MSEEQAPYHTAERAAPTPPRPLPAYAPRPGEAKYVVLIRGGFEVPVICPADVGVDHATMVSAHVVSAGFTNTRTWEAHGESISLGTKSRPEHDTALLRKYFGTPEPGVDQ